MKISFDLDETLIPARSTDFPTEKRNFTQNLLGIEPIRVGTIALFKELKRHGHSVGIYTTSYRPELKILMTFLAYGVKLDFVINEEKNRKKLIGKHAYCSKYPPAFGIDLHIDDSVGVGMEAVKHNFQAIIIKSSDLNWIDKILNSYSYKIFQQLQVENKNRNSGKLPKELS